MHTKIFATIDPDLCTVSFERADGKPTYIRDFDMDDFKQAMKEAEPFWPWMPKIFWVKLVDRLRDASGTP